MQITPDFQSYFFENDIVQPRTLSDICRICNIPGSHLVKRFLQDQSFLFHTQYAEHETKLVLTYSIPVQLRNFFFDPGRSQQLYCVPWIIGKCWEAIECAIKSQPDSGHSVLSSRIACGLCHFFTPKKNCQFSRASLMLSAALSNGSDSDSVLGFLKSLSRIPWLDICFSNPSNALWTCAIANWVCKSLVSEHVLNYDYQINQILYQESSSLPSGNIRNAMHEILTEIILRGILPALRVSNFWFKKTGILEDKDGSVCWKCSIPQILIGRHHWLNTDNFEMLPSISFVCTGQDFFQLLCTTIVEAILFGMVYWTTIYQGYVFPYNLSMVLT